MFCPICGTRNRKEDKICVHCGDGLNAPKITDKIPFFGSKHKGVFCPTVETPNITRIFVLIVDITLKMYWVIIKLIKKK